jgi:hypothetical protein
MTHPAAGEPLRPLLFCAHPGHELRLYAWLRRAQPTICFLTDGSGLDGAPRLARSRAVAETTGAVPGSVYGFAPDRAIYAALLAGDVTMFAELARRIGTIVVEDGHASIVADAAEGYNPSHDVARIVADAAVAIARTRGARVENYAYPVVGHPRRMPNGCRPGPYTLSLNDPMLHEKIACGRAYSVAAGGILASQVDEALERFGNEAFREEHVFAVDPDVDLIAMFDGERPWYDAYGREQAGAGRYPHAIGWAEHVRPVALALRQLAASPELTARTSS